MNNEEYLITNLTEQEEDEIIVDKSLGIKILLGVVTIFAITIIATLYIVL